MEKQFIYMDYAATTPVDPQVFEAMQPWFTAQYGNASAVYTMGHEAQRALDTARAQVAGALGCRNAEVVFTAGGTESDNLAVFGVVREALKTHAPQDVHVVTTAIEHAAVLEACRALEKEGVRVTYVPVTADGIVKVEDVVAAIEEQTVLVSVMMANNEIGTIQPVAEVARAVKEKNQGVLVHTDACQAMGFLDVRVEELGVDLLTINASKIYGPKGVGALYVRRGVKITPLVYGGHQERELRPGTENVAGIVGFGKAVELALEGRAEEAARLTGLRDQLIDGILQEVSGTTLNGSREDRLPNNVNMLIKGIDGESLLFALDAAGVQASLGSACAAGSIDPSHVLLALGYSKEQAKSSLRLTLGKQTTEEEVQRVIAIIAHVVQQLKSRN